jgi:Family of unknown function (DUF6402)
MPFTLRDIPSAMRRSGWPVGATLMDRWFNTGARSMGPQEKAGDAPSPDIETRAVTMRWGLGFGRVASAHSELLATWHSAVRLQRSSQTMTNRLRKWRAAKGGSGAFRFGDLSRPVAEVDAACQINFQTVESGMFAAADDFYAAMGRALIKIAVSGMVTPLPSGRFQLSIDEIGTYIRDTYDFIGDQSLGSWGPDGLRRVAVFAPDIPVIAETARDQPGQDYWSVDNKSFRDWRAHYARGGDFVILSDVRRQKLQKPVVVEVIL